RTEQARVSTTIEDFAAGHAGDFRGGQFLLPAKALEESRRSCKYLRTVGEGGRLEFELLLLLLVQGFLDRLIVQLYVFSRPEEPLLNLPVQHGIAEEDQETDRHEAQRQRAEIQLGLDPRALAVASAFDVQLDAGAEKDEAQRDGEDKNQSGNSPEDESLVQIFGVFVEFSWPSRIRKSFIERYLPDDKRGQNEE